MMVPVMQGSRVKVLSLSLQTSILLAIIIIIKVSASRCNCTIKDPHCWFDFGNALNININIIISIIIIIIIIVGNLVTSYALDMSNVFERAIAFLILCLIGIINIITTTIITIVIIIIIIIANHPTYIFTRAEYEEKPGSGKMKKLDLIQNLQKDRYYHCYHYHSIKDIDNSM